MLRRRRYAVIVAIMLLTGCGASINEILIGQNPNKPAKQPSEMIVLMEQQPNKPYRDVVNYSCNFCWSRQDSIEEMKRLAAVRGLDGVHTVRCAAPGTVGSATCDGIGFVYK